MSSQENETPETLQPWEYQGRPALFSQSTDKALTDYQAAEGRKIVVVGQNVFGTGPNVKAARKAAGVSAADRQVIFDAPMNTAVSTFDGGLEWPDMADDGRPNVAAFLLYIPAKKAAR